ncbi:MAG: hypothetical protein U9O85_00675 [Euryarchaeota archaeon]|nr:hypothetical protein [Euryarchaeota archaeon]
MKMLRDSENNKGVGIGVVRIKKKKLIVVAVAVLTLLVVFIGIALQPVAAHTWPTSWTWIDSDPNENGWQDDFRDVKNAYYNYDDEYLYLRMCCYANATLTSPNQEARFKWFIDLDHNAYKSGQNIIEGDYLLFVEDYDPDNGTGDVYLLNDTSGDGKFNEWEASSNYYSGGLVTNGSVAGYRITGKCVDLYVRLANITNPSNLSLIWVTDQENPNLDQAPTTDHPDSVPIGPLCIHCAPVFSIAKYDWPDPVKAGENLTYTIIYENAGNANATNVTITEVYDNNVTFLNATPAPDPGTNDTWTIPNLPVDGKHYLNITVRVNGTVADGTILHNYVNITCDQGVEDNHTITTEVVGEPVLSITKYAWPDPVAPCGNLTYTILFENIGNATATNTALNDTLPPEVTFVSASPEPDNKFDDNHTLFWDIGNLPQDELRTITINVTVNCPLPCGSILVNNVNFSADDAETVNHTEKTIVRSVPRLEIEKFDSLDPVEAGAPLNYTIYVNNTGCANATNVTVTEFYDANVTFVTADPYPNSENNIWNFSTLNVSESKKITITVNVTSPLPNGTILLNFANVTCDQGMKDQIYQDTTVTSAPYCSLAKYDFPDPVKAGANLTYTIICENTGNMNATNGVITEEYDANVTFVNATPAPDDFGTNNATWLIPHAPPGVKHYINITVRVNDTVANDTILTNNVSVTADQDFRHNHTIYTEVVGDPH